MIEAVILDVDGVLVGSQLGINYPNPHRSVIDKLKQIRQKGIPVILCTGSYYFAKLPTIHHAQLHNPHITDNGALIIDPLANKVLSKHSFDRKIVHALLTAFIKSHIYLEVFTDKNYFVQTSQSGALTQKRIIFMQQEPHLSDDLTKLAKNENIIRINAFSHNNHQKNTIKTILTRYQKTTTTTWSSNPALLPIEVAMITASGISKTYGAQEVIQSLGLTFDHVLGVGDNIGDWQFMSLCQYVAAMGNATNELKEMITTKGEGNYFLAPHVDDHGILEVFRNFSI